MEENVTIIKGSFRGIASILLKYLAFIIIFVVVFLLTNNIHFKYFWNYSFKSIMVLEFGKFAILTLIYLSYVLSTVFALIFLYKLIKLLYDPFKKITIDKENNKIIAISYRLPFSKNIEENIFSEFTSVTVKQNSLERIFKTGKLCLEYYISTSVDSFYISFEIANIVYPDKIKEKLI